MAPEKIGRYQVKSELGRGGMATVYRAYDPSFDREVAIKVLPREFLHDPQFHERFKNEIKTIAALEHPAIVPVYDVGDDDGVPYFVMRNMTGGSLSSQIEKGKFSIHDAARIIERLSSALAYAHKKGVVHRDLKPDNILFDDRGDPYITDFGVASFSSTPTNLTGTSAIGTPAYMSPEQAQGDKVDNRSDIYGLGVIIFQMLSGEQPYNADTPMAVAIKHITDPVPDILKNNPSLPMATDLVIKTAMAKNREDRYPSATELARAFRDLAKEDEDFPYTGESSRKPASAKKSTNNRMLIFGGIAVVGVIGLIVIIALGTFLFKRLAPTTASSDDPSATTDAAAGASGSEYFTEDFNGSIDNWSKYVITGNETELSLGASDGFLLFELPGKDQEFYANYSPHTYENVRITVKVDNQNQNVSNVGIICRYNEDKGWYEFNIASNGYYKILYRSWNDEKRGAAGAAIFDGATPEILTGKNVNEYVATCNGRTLSLSVNGVEVRSKIDNQFLLSEGSVGVGVGSLTKGPVEVGIDSISISQP